MYSDRYALAHGLPTVQRRETSSSRARGPFGFLTVAEVARELGVSERTVYRWMSKGRGKRRLLPVDVLRFVAATKAA